MKKAFLSFIFAVASLAAQDTNSLNLIVKVVDSSVFTTPNKPISLQTTVLVYGQDRAQAFSAEIELIDDKGVSIFKTIKFPGCACTAPVAKYRLFHSIYLDYDRKIVSAKATRMVPEGQAETLVVK